MEDKESMTKSRMFLFATLALIMAFGAFGQFAQAADGPQFPVHARIIGPAEGISHGANPNVTPGGATAFTAMGPLPPVDSGSSISWPAFCGPSVTGSVCASDPAGSILIGVPEETWSLASCTSSTTACGQAYNFFLSNTATGEWKYEIEVTQGTKVIYWSGLVDAMEVFPAGYIGALDFPVAFGVGDCAKGKTCVAPVAGAATPAVR
jgi:hypothetical protein